MLREGVDYVNNPKVEGAKSETNDIITRSFLSVVLKTLKVIIKSILDIVFNIVEASASGKRYEHYDSSNDEKINRP